MSGGSASKELNIWERPKLKELEKENRELCGWNVSFLKNAAAFFAKEQRVRDTNSLHCGRPAPTPVVRIGTCNR